MYEELHLLKIDVFTSLLLDKMQNNAAIKKWSIYH